MKVLIAEDNESKRDRIVATLLEIGFLRREVHVATNVAEALERCDQSVDIFIIDLRLPAYDRAPEYENGLLVLEMVGKMCRPSVKIIAISSYPQEFDSVRSKFESRGCMLVSYAEDAVWESALRLMRVQALAVERKDFLIFCALREERAPYTACVEPAGINVFRDNVTRYDFMLGGFAGSVVELPRMGLVDAAVTAGVFIDRFAPKLVAMSGICAGFSGKAALGQLLISDLAYEYQTGKWTADGFSQEPYQIPMSQDVRSIVCELLEDKDILQRLEMGCAATRPVQLESPSLVAFTSGSAVIASSALMDQVGSHHRKVSGLDMEVYALHRAAHLSKHRPDVLCAKVVVDLGDGDKSDSLHAYGCFVSAKFVLQAIRLYFDRRSA